MAKNRYDERTIRQSVLDRLIDLEPDRLQDDPQDDHQVIRAIQKAVRRDVENLLNTRYRCEVWPPQCDKLNDSLVNYGLPDFTAAGLNLVNDNDTLISAIRDALVRFEPRLRDVRVEQISAASSYDRMFRFRILATLKIESIEQEIRFDSEMETLSGQIEIG